MTYVPNMIHICPNKRCLDVFGGEIRERRERICLGNYPKSFFFFTKWGVWGHLWTLARCPRLDAPCMCARATRLTPAILSFSCLLVSNLTVYLKAFMDFDWADLGLPRKLWMDQKLWPWEAYWCTFHGLLDNFTILTPILPQE